MNDYSSLRKRKNSTFMAVVALTLCVTLSAAFLFSRLVDYSAYRAQQYIPLTVSNGVTQVTTLQKQAPFSAPMVHKLSAAVPLDETKPDEEGEKTWLTMTELELFKASYENDKGEITVQSANGDDIIAPGTSNSYTFSLQNTSDMGLDYTIEVEAYFAIEGGDQGVPVQLRLSDYNGNYLIGGPNSFEDLSDVNMAHGNGSVTAGYIIPYTLEWQWPFEGNDALDTALGSMMIETGATVTFVMEIRTTAVQGDGGGGLPSTGDTDGMLVAGMVLAGSFVSLVFMLIPKRKREEENAQN